MLTAHLACLLAASALSQSSDFGGDRRDVMPATLVVHAAAWPQPEATPAEKPGGTDRLEEIVGPSEPELLASGLQFTEGPVWVPAKNSQPGYLLFSDIPADTIYRLDPPKKGEIGKPEVIRKPSGKSNGLILDREGRLVICEHAGRVIRLETNGDVTVLAEKWEDKRLNSPNDLCVGKDGSIFFTDPPYGLGGPLGFARESETKIRGVYRIDPQGKLHLVIDDLETPNGIALSPDNTTLYVGNHGKGVVWSYAVKADGTVGEGKVFAELRAGQRRAGADGVRTDREGNVYVGAGRSGVHVLDPKGELIGIIGLPRGATNLCFGGDDGRTLFVVAGDSVYSLRVKIAGSGM